MQTTSLLIIFGLNIIALVVFGLWLIRRSTGHATLNYARLVQHLGTLLQRGYHGAIVVLQSREGVHFIQIKKYIEREQFGIELGFPSSQWSINYIDQIKALAEKYDLPIAASNSQGGVQFIYVDFKQNIEIASRFCMEIISQIYQVPPSTRFDVSFDKISYSKDYPELSDHPSGFVFTNRH